MVFFAEMIMPPLLDFLKSFTSSAQIRYRVSANSDSKIMFPINFGSVRSSRNANVRSFV